MMLDGIIISDYGQSSFSATNSMRLNINGQIASIQNVANFLDKDQVVSSEIMENIPCWESSPKLNGVFLMSYLKKNGYNFALINNFEEEREEFVSLIKQGPKIILISTTFIYEKKTLHSLIEEVKSMYKDAFIVVGGHFVYSSYMFMEKSKTGNYEYKKAEDDFLFLKIGEEPVVDVYIVSSRGEKTIIELMEAMNIGKSFDSIKNVGLLKNGEYFFSDRIMDVCCGEDLGIDWDALPKKIFANKVVSVQASSGCTFNCSFCNFTKEKGKTCLKPFSLLLSELKKIQENGVNYVWFSDDNFRLGKKDLNQFCERIIKEKISLKWMSFIRASTLECVDMQLLKKSGCIEVQLGIESASKKILKNMNKDSSPDLYRNVVKNLLGSGIDCSCYFIIGFPGETDETIKETFDFIKEIETYSAKGCFSWSIFPFILSPLSPIYEKEERDKYNLSGYMHHWQHDTMTSSEARQKIKEIFFGLDFSGPIYRGDNLHSLGKLDCADRKKFLYTRHRLAKKSAIGSLVNVDSEINDSFRFLSYEK